MSTTAKTAGRGLASNWDLALTSSALLLIVGGLAAPHIRRLIARDGDNAAPDGLGGGQREGELGDRGGLPQAAAEQLLHA
jgi:hypothetical protein